MKKSIIQIVGLCLCIFFLSTCRDKPTYHHDGHIDKKIIQEPVIHHGPTSAHTSDYVCPLHCENSGSDKPGVCPNCGFDYESLKQHISNGHNH